MKMICANCHFVGEGKKPEEYNIKSINVYFGLVLASTILSFLHPLFLVGTFIFLIYLVGAYASFYDYGDLCPECGKLSMLPPDLPEAHKIISDNNLTVESLLARKSRRLAAYQKLKFLKTKICTECLYTGVSKQQKECDIYSAIIFIIVGISSIAFAFIHPLALFGSLAFFVLAIVYFYRCVVDTDLCPNCEKNLLIPLESDPAKQIIKTTNLKVTPPIIHPPFLIKNRKIGLLIAWFLFLLAFCLLSVLYIFLTRYNS